ncbi:hypothetical protein AGMMS50296_6170 [Alphaproteobacteria bacterium]|nr:hypothetical protein AGMMS50296_6170 [Alphaproteobacteria bacterium]
MDLCLQALSKELFLTGLLDAAGLVSATACVFVEHKSDLLLHPKKMPDYENSRNVTMAIYEITQQDAARPLRLSAAELDLLGSSPSTIFSSSSSAPSEPQSSAKNSERFTPHEKIRHAAAYNAVMTTLWYLSQKIIQNVLKSILDDVAKQQISEREIYISRGLVVADLNPMTVLASRLTTALSSVIQKLDFYGVLWGTDHAGRNLGAWFEFAHYGLNSKLDSESSVVKTPHQQTCSTKSWKA